MDRIRETATYLIMKTYKENGVLSLEQEPCADDETLNSPVPEYSDTIRRNSSANIRQKVPLTSGVVHAIIELKVDPEPNFGYDRIAKRIARFDQVRNLRLRTGSHDLELLVTGENMQEIARFASEQIASMKRIRRLPPIS